MQLKEKSRSVGKVGLCETYSYTAINLEQQQTALRDSPHKLFEKNSRKLQHAYQIRGGKDPPELLVLQ